MTSPLIAIKPSERKSVALLFLYGFGNAASYVLARTVADSTFLSRFGSDRLPELYMLAAGVVALTSLIYSRILQRWGLRRCVVGTLSLFAVGSVVLCLLKHEFPASLGVFASSYLLAQIRGSLGTIQYATVLNEQFGRRGLARVVGLVGAGATLAGISMGMLIGFLPQQFEITWLLYAAAGIDVMTIIPLLLLRARRKQQRRLKKAKQQRKSQLSVPATELDEPNDLDELVEDEISEEVSLDIEPSTRASRALAPTPSASARREPIRLRDLTQSSYVLCIAVTVAVFILATTLVEYQWKVVAASTLQRDANQLARYFGFFYGTVYLVTGLLQLFVTSALLRRHSARLGLMIFPTALLATTLAAWFAASELALFLSMTLSKGTDTLRRSFFDPTHQILYGPLKKKLRRQAITFVSGIVKPFSEAVAGFSLVLLTRWLTPQQLSPIVGMLLVVILILSRELWLRYEDELYSSRGVDQSSTKGPAGS